MTQEISLYVPNLIHSTYQSGFHIFLNELDAVSFCHNRISFKVFKVKFKNVTAKGIQESIKFAITYARNTAIFCVIFKVNYKNATAKGLQKVFKPYDVIFAPTIVAQNIQLVEEINVPRIYQ